MPAERIAIDARAVVGWSRPSHPGRQYYCPPHVPKSQRTLGEQFLPVTAGTARACVARCDTCGDLLRPEAEDGPDAS